MSSMSGAKSVSQGLCVCATANLERGKSPVCKSTRIQSCNAGRVTAEAVFGVVSRPSHGVKG